MSSTSKALCGFTVGCSLFLQGCGGGGGGDSTTTTVPDGPTTTTTTTTTTAMTTTTTTTTPTTPWPFVPSPAASWLLIHQLNRDFDSWDPSSPSSTPGIAIAVGTEPDFFPACVYDKCDMKNGKWPPCDSAVECAGPNTDFPGGLSRECRVSGSLVNSLVSLPGDQRLYLNGEMGGWLYDNDALEQILMCSYANDGGTDGRANRGCGCGIANPPNVTVHDEKHPTPCMNIDAKTGKEPTQDSLLIRDCMCKDGYSDVQLRGCVFEGPAFYHGVGQNNLHGMLKARNHLNEEEQNKTNSTLAGYTEVVLDGLLQHELLMKQGPGKVIKALVKPLNKGKCGKKCVRELQIMHNRIVGQYKGKGGIPVVGFDFSAKKSPFSAVNLEDVEPTVV